MTVCTTLIIDYFHEPRRRNKYLGLQTVTTTLAATLFIILGGALGVGGWHTPFWVYAVSIAIAVPMIFLLWEPTPAEAGDTRDVAGEKVRIPWRRIGVPLIVTIFGGFTFYVIIIEASYLVVGTGVAAPDTATIGLVAAIASLATAIGGLTFARIAKLTPGRLLPLAFGLQAVGMIVIWVVPGLAGIIIGAIIASFGSGLLLPSLVTWVVAATLFEDRGRVTGLWTSAFFFGQFLTPILMGVIGADCRRTVGRGGRRGHRRRRRRAPGRTQLSGGRQRPASPAESRETRSGEEASMIASHRCANPCQADAAVARDRLVVTARRAGLRPASSSSDARATRTGTGCRTGRPAPTSTCRPAGRGRASVLALR